MPLPVVLPLHPRTRARLEDAGLLDALDGVILAPPLGYLEFMGAAGARAGGADRLRRRAEGGLPRGRAVRDAALDDGVARDGRRRLERARRPRRGRRARRPATATCRTRDRRCTATGARASASSTRSSGWRHDRSRRQRSPTTSVGIRRGRRAIGGAVGAVVIKPGTVIGAGVEIQDGAVLGKSPSLARSSTASKAPLAGLVIGDGAVICCGAIVFAGAHARARA